MKNKNITVLYIAGNGHSGSTLLDIILGSSHDIFSCGELTFITRDSIFNEYCSCKKLIAECNVWSLIVELWMKKSPITLQDYKKSRLRFERNKTTLTTFFNKIKPSNEFKLYCLSTRILFESILEVTGKSIVIDSSKSPQRIAVLDKIVDLKVIHLCRNLKGVLNSSKKNSKKNIQAGIETDLPARRTFKVILEWIYVNFITEIFCIGIDSVKLKYNDYVKNLDFLEIIHPKIKISKNNNFIPFHILAGNVIRLKDEIKINSNLGFEYKRLSKPQKILATFFDHLFFRWS